MGEKEKSRKMKLKFYNNSFRFKIVYWMCFKNFYDENCLIINCPWVQFDHLPMFNLNEGEKSKKSALCNLCCLLSVLTRAAMINEIFFLYFSIIKECVWCFDLERQITEIAFENSFRPGYNFFLHFFSISMPSPSFDCLHVSSLIALLIKHRLCSSSSYSLYSTLRLYTYLSASDGGWLTGLSVKYEIIMQ